MSRANKAAQDAIEALNANGISVLNITPEQSLAKWRVTGWDGDTLLNGANTAELCAFALGVFVGTQVNE